MKWKNKILKYYRHLREKGYAWVSYPNSAICYMHFPWLWKSAWFSKTSLSGYSYSLNRTALHPQENQIQARKTLTKYPPNKKTQNHKILQVMFLFLAIFKTKCRFPLSQFAAELVQPHRGKMLIVCTWVLPLANNEVVSLCLPVFLY